MPVALQRRQGSGWRTVARAVTHPSGRFGFPYEVPPRERDLFFRLIGGRRSERGSILVGTTRVDVIGQELHLRGAAGWLVGTSRDVSVTSEPSGPRRPVLLERWLGDSWLLVPNSGTRLDTNGRARIALPTDSLPAWYRVQAPQWKGLPALGSVPFRAAMDERIAVVAHRAGSGEAPESTLAAVESAISAGYEAIEADLRLTADGELVVMHDHSLERTTNVEELFPERSTYSVGAFTLGEIKSLDAGSWMSERFAGSRVPTALEWLRAIDGRAHVELEIKSPSSSLASFSALMSLLSTNTALPMIAAERLTIASFDLDWLASVYRQRPDVRYGALTGRRPSINEIRAWSSWVGVIIVPSTAVDAGLVSDLRASGVDLELYTPNTYEELRSAAEWHPSGIITDYPGRLKELLSPRIPSTAPSAAPARPQASE